MKKKAEGDKPKFKEPQLGGRQTFVQIFDPPFPEITMAKWLIYKLPDWIPDESVSNCLLCDTKFTFVTRRVCLFRNLS